MLSYDKTKHTEVSQDLDFLSYVEKLDDIGKKLDAQAKRYNSGKLQWTQIDFNSLEELVKVLEYGAKKYGKDNWKKGLPITEIAESLLRHLFAFLDGEDNDKESGESHIGHIMANAMFMNYVHKNKPHFDDRYSPKESHHE